MLKNFHFISSELLTFWGPQYYNYSVEGSCCLLLLLLLLF
jgi:hypothetical protein